MKVGDLIILKDESATRGSLFDSVARIEAFVTEKHPDRYKGAQGLLYELKAYRHGTLRLFARKAISSLPPQPIDMNWEYDAQQSGLKVRCCNVCCDLLINANHKDRRSGNSFWKCSNSSCTVGAWQKADGSFTSHPADQPTRTARAELFQVIQTTGNETSYGRLCVTQLIQRVGELSIGKLSHRECAEYLAMLHEMLGRRPPSAVQASVQAGLSALGVPVSKRKQAQPDEPQIMSDGVRKFDLD